MQKLLHFLIAGITGSDKFEVEESVEDDRILLNIKADTTLIGMIIGKEGKTIRAIRKIMSIKATLENKLVNVAIASDEA